MHGIDIGRKLTLDEYDYLRGRGDIAFVARYYDGSLGASAKALSTTEVSYAFSRRMGIVPVFEIDGLPFLGDPNDPQVQARARENGRFHGQLARADGLACGQPLGTPIPTSIDESIDPSPALTEYFNGYYSGLDGAFPAGLYGRRSLCQWARESLPGLAFFWLTYAWSGGLDYAPADVYQHANGVTLRPGLVVDLNIARSPIPWRLA